MLGLAVKCYLQKRGEKNEKERKPHYGTLFYNFRLLSSGLGRYLHYKQSESKYGSENMKKLNEKYDAIIIEAGIGGLTCANLFAKNGLKTLVLEQHSRPGGYVTSYKRNGFTFDVPHVIGGIAPNGNIGRLLSYLGLDKNIEWVESDQFQKFIYPRHTLRVPLDIAKYERTLIELFPSESKGITKFFETLKRIWKESNKMPFFLSKLRLVIFPLEYPTIFKYRNKTLKDLLDEHFEDNELKAILSSLWGYLGSPPSKLSVLTYANMLMCFHLGGAGYPKGGFQKLADAFTDGLKNYGGDLKLNSMVVKVLIKDKKAIGIELRNGQKIKATYVISDADSRRTFLELVGEEYLNTKFVHRLKNMELSPSGFVVHLGVDMELEKYDLNYATIMYSPSYDAVEKAWKRYRENEFLDMNSTGFGLSVPSLKDHDLAPKGKHCMDLMIMPAPYHYKNDWMTEQGKRGEEYRRLKENIAEGLIKAAENVVPELSKHIVVKDISTPMTYERYTLSSEGAWYDMAQIPGQTGIKRLSRKTEISGLYLTGASSFSGGMFGAISSGLLTADEILKGKLTGRKLLLQEQKL